ncbi:MAG TPA: NifU family protein [Bacteroidia bacterium]|nr:NifU family protein [Bacteroidia bacterium]
MTIQDIPFIFYAEETPNPNSLKFVANKLLLVSGASADYESAATAKDAPLALQLFSFPFVKRVFFASNFVTVTRHDNTEWEDVRDELRTFLTSYMNANKPVISKLPEQAVPKDSTFNDTLQVNTQHSAPQNEVENKIIEVLEQYIRPAVEQDGGLITFKELVDGKVVVQLRGSCSGCPSSTMTLKAGIEALLKRLLPDHVKEVVSEAL